MVSAVVVVLISTVACIVAIVPNVGKCGHGFRFPTVQGLKEMRIYCSAIPCNSVSVKFKAVGKEVFVACHNVCKVSKGL